MSSTSYFMLYFKAASDFQERFFKLDHEVASLAEYDIVVAGTGIGGGVLAGDFFDTNSMIRANAQDILVIKRGTSSFIRTA